MCDKTFTDSAMRYLHVKRDHEISNYQCHSCNYSNKGLYNYNRHLKNKHSKNVENSKVDCPECGKKLKHQHSLKQHIKQVHLDSDKYKCEICGKCFGAPGNLKTHNLFHAKIKKFPCLICEKEFYTKQSLGYHMKAIHIH